MADFGQCMSCITDLSGDGRLVSGNIVIAEAIARRLSTPRGRLIGYPDYGFDISQYINADMSPRDIASLRSSIEAECLKDERVSEAEVSAVLDSVGVLTLTIKLVANDTELTLVLSVSDVTIDLVSVT